MLVLNPLPPKLQRGPLLLVYKQRQLFSGLKCSKYPPAHQVTDTPLQSALIMSFTDWRPPAMGLTCCRYAAATSQKAAVLSETFWWGEGVRTGAEGASCSLFKLLYVFFFFLLKLQLGFNWIIKSGEVLLVFLLVWDKRAFFSDKKYLVSPLKLK